MAYLIVQLLELRQRGYVTRFVPGSGGLVGRSRHLES